MSDTSLVFTIIGRDRSAGALGSASQRISKLRTGLLVGFGAVTAAVGSSINKAADFDKTIRVAGAAANASADELKAMSTMALEMGSKTQFGAKGAADAMLELAKGGMTIAEIKAGALAGTMTLAAAGGLELGAASTYMVNTLSVFGLKAADAAKVAAALAGGANASTASVESLGMALAQVGPGAKNAGLSMEETIAVLSAFDKAGVKGSDAGTSLKTMLTRLVPMSDAARTSMKKLGLDFTKADGSFVSISNVAEQLKDKLSKLSGEQRTQALATMFGSDATRAATILMEQGADGLAGYIKATKDLTAAEKMAKTQTEGAAGNMRRFKATVDSLQIAFGLHLLPAVTFVTGALSDLVMKISSKVDPAMGRLKDLARDVAPAFDKVRDAVRAAFGKLDLSGVGTSLTSSSKGWAQAIIGGVQQGFDSGDWSGLGGSLGKGVGSALSTSGDLAVTFFSWIGQQIKKVDWMSLGVAMGKQAPTLLAGLAIGILNFDLGSLLSGLGDHWFEVILGVLTVAFMPFKLVAGIAKLLAKIPFAGKLLAWGVTAIHKGSRGLAKAGGRLFVEFASGVIRSLARTFPRLGNALEKGLVGLVYILTGGAPKFGAAVGRWGKRMLGALASVPGRLAAKGGELVGGLLSGLLKGAGKLDGWLGGWGGRIVGKVGNLGGLLVQKGKDFVQGFINGMTSMGSAVKDKAVDLANKATFGLAGRLGIKSPSRVAIRFGRWFSQGFAIGIKEKTPEVIERVKELVEKLREKVQAVRDFAKDIRESFRSMADVSSFDYGDGSESLLTQLQRKADQAIAFARGLGQLRKMGLNEGTIAQLREAGPDSGFAGMQQLLGSDIGQVNRLVSQIAKAGAALGESEAQRQFGFGSAGPKTVKVKSANASVKVDFDFGNKGAENALVEAIRKAVRVRGGDVNVVFGK